jgi:hypothetical protein
MRSKATRDNCEVCHGTQGGVPGNENRINGIVMCDYCHAEWMEQRDATRQRSTDEPDKPHSQGKQDTGDDVSREAATRMPVRGPSPTTTVLAHALHYAIALCRNRLDVEAPANAEIIRDFITALEAVAAQVAAFEAAPTGAFGYCATCYHPLDVCSHCDAELHKEEEESDRDAADDL